MSCLLLVANLIPLSFVYYLELSSGVARKKAEGGLCCVLPTLEDAAAERVAYLWGSKEVNECSMTNGTYLL